MSGFLFCWAAMATDLSLEGNAGALSLLFSNPIWILSNSHGRHCFLRWFKFSLLKTEGIKFRSVCYRFILWLQGFNIPAAAHEQIAEALGHVWVFLFLINFAMIKSFFQSLNHGNFFSSHKRKKKKSFFRLKFVILDFNLFKSLPQVTVLMPELYLHFSI